MKRVTQAELAARLSEILEEVNKTSETYEITLTNNQNVILMSTDEYESVEALIELLQSRVETDRSIESNSDQQSETEIFSLDEVREKLRNFHQIESSDRHLLDWLEDHSGFQAGNSIREGRKDIAEGRYFVSEDDAFGKGATQSRLERAIRLGESSE